MSITLCRVAQSSKGTFGVLVKDDIPLCVTCEEPWNNNLRKKSCIPAGVYNCVKHFGEKYKNVWRLEDVPGRSDVLIHHGNNITDTEGCILVGELFGVYEGLPAVLNSKLTLERLRGILPSEFTITIKECI